ncbi:hypothetical protein HY990_04060 [Candidatus Micrarchaeota archaeon]|nr:hypothetical protein [Candidatus Micrarchaeota archaeon]
MNRNRVLSYIFILLGLVVVVGCAYMIAAYASDMLKSIVDFVTTSDYAKLRQCGITTPPEFDKIKQDLTTIILPFLYAGLPLLFLATSLIMFVAGTYYNKAQAQEETEKRERIKQDFVTKLTRKEQMKSQNPQNSGTVTIKPKETKAPEIKTVESSSTEEDEQ